jgi:hypothetical protein
MEIAGFDKNLADGRRGSLPRAPKKKTRTAEALSSCLFPSLPPSFPALRAGTVGAPHRTDAAWPRTARLGAEGGREGGVGGRGPAFLPGPPCPAPLAPLSLFLPLPLLASVATRAVRSPGGPHPPPERGRKSTFSTAEGEDQREPQPQPHQPGPSASGIARKLNPPRGGCVRAPATV